MVKNNETLKVDVDSKFRIYEFINRHHQLYDIPKREIREQLCKVADVSMVQLYRWMKIKKGDKTKIYYQSIKAIAKYFGVTIDVLYND